MPFIDLEAAEMVRTMRKRQGLSPETLAEEICAMCAREGWHKLGGVDGSTIRRIEGIPEKGRPGFVPSVRVACVIARYFGLAGPEEIWKSTWRVKVPVA